MIQKNSFPMRINKYLAHNDFCTRRQADELISQKKVFINDKPAKLGDKVLATDKIEVRSSIKKYNYYKYYKPRGLVTHSNNEKKEVDIIKSLPLKNIFPLGRLDKDSEGLIILTNDGRLTDRLLNPEYSHDKEYEVTTDKELKTSFANKMSKGVLIEDYMTKPCQVIILGERKFRLILTEGKKHQIRRMCTALGYTVNKLKRVRILNINLGKLKSGEYEKITDEELNIFLKKLNINK